MNKPNIWVWLLPWRAKRRIAELEEHADGAWGCLQMVREDILEPELGKESADRTPPMFFTEALFTVMQKRIDKATPGLRDKARRTEQAEAWMRQAETALVAMAIPCEAVLMDTAGRKWFAPDVWTAMEQAVRVARAHLANRPLNLKMDQPEVQL